MSRLRRHYPKNNFGGKDEWHGLVLHQSGIEGEIEKIEKNIKNLKTKVFV